MGSYLNPGYSGFQSSIKGTKYVDKTLLIEKTNEWMDSSKKLAKEKQSGFNNRAQKKAECGGGFKTAEK